MCQYDFSFYIPICFIHYLSTIVNSIISSNYEASLIILYNIVMRKFVILPIVFSLLFIGISTYDILKPDEKYLTTTGKIVRIVEDYDISADAISYTTYIDYEVNNTKYRNVEYGAYNSSMNVGDEVTVYYLENNPTFIQAEGYEKTPYIVIGISLVFLIISIVILVKK